MFKKRKINKLFKAVDLELNNKNFDKALIFVNNILSLDENNFNALYKKAYIIYLKGSYKEAINTLKHILNIKTCEEVLLLLGRISFLLEDYDAGINYYKLSLDINIFNYEKYVDEIFFFGDVKEKYISQNYLKFSKYSLDLCDLIIEEYDDADTKLWKSYKLYLLDRYDESLEILEDLLFLIPDNPLVYYLKAANLLKFKQYEESIIFAEKGLNLDSNEVLLIQIKAKALYFLKEYEESLYYFNKANTVEEIHDSYLFISKINIVRGEWFNSLENINKAIQGSEDFFNNLKISPSESFYQEDYLNLFWYKSFILYKLGKFDDAKKILDCLIDKEENVKYYCLKAKILYEMNDYEASLKFVNKTLDLDSNCSHAKSLKEKIEKQI